MSLLLLSSEPEPFEYVIEPKLCPLPPKVKLHFRTTTSAKLLPTPAVHSREEPVKHVLEPAGTRTTGPPALCLPLDPLLAQLIIDPALVWVAERLVSVRYLLELFLGGLWVVLVFVRVVPDRLLLEGLLDLVLGGVTLQTQQLVVVLARLHRGGGKEDY